MELQTKALSSSLVVIKRDGSDGRRYVLDDRFWCVLGSHQDCDIRIHSDGVVQLHALFLEDSGVVKLYGLHQDLPTMVPSRKKILFKDDGAELVHGDVFFVSDRAFRFERYALGTGTEQPTASETSKRTDIENDEPLNAPLVKAYVHRKGTATTPTRKGPKKVQRRHSLIVRDLEEVFVEAAKTTSRISKSRLSVASTHIASAFAADHVSSQESKTSPQDHRSGSIGAMTFALSYTPSKPAPTFSSEQGQASDPAGKKSPFSKQAPYINNAPSPIMPEKKLATVLPSVAKVTPKKAQRVVPAMSNPFQKSAQRVATPVKSPAPSRTFGQSSPRNRERGPQRASPQQRLQHNGEKRKLHAQRASPSKTTPARVTLQKSGAMRTTIATTPARATGARVTPGRGTPARGTPSWTSSSKVLPLRTAPARSTPGKVLSSATPKRATQAAISCRAETPARVASGPVHTPKTVHNRTTPARFPDTNATPKRVSLVSEAVARRTITPRKALTGNAKLKGGTPARSPFGKSRQMRPSPPEKTRLEVGPNRTEAEQMQSEKPKLAPSSKTMDSIGISSGHEVDSEKMSNEKSNFKTVPDKVIERDGPQSSSQVEKKSHVHVETPSANHSSTLPPISLHKLPQTDEAKEKCRFPRPRVSRAVKVTAALSAKKEQAFARLSAGLSAISKAVIQDEQAPKLSITVNAMVPENGVDTMKKMLVDQNKENASGMQKSKNDDINTPSELKSDRKHSKTPSRAPLSPANGRSGVNLPVSGRPPKPSSRSRRTPLPVVRSIQKAGKRGQTMSERKRGVVFHPVIELEAGPHYSPCRPRNQQAVREQTPEPKDRTTRKLDLDMLPMPSPGGRAGTGTDAEGSHRVLGPPPSTPLARLGRFLYPKGPAVPLLMAPPSDDSSDDDVIPREPTPTTDSIPPTKEAGQESNRRSSIGATISNLWRRVSGGFSDQGSQLINEDENLIEDASGDSSSSSETESPEKSENGSPLQNTDKHGGRLGDDATAAPNSPVNSDSGHRMADDEELDSMVDMPEPSTPKDTKRLSLFGRVCHVAAAVADAVSPGQGLLDSSEEESVDSMEIDDEQVPLSDSQGCGYEAPLEKTQEEGPLLGNGSGRKRSVNAKEPDAFVANKKRASLVGNSSERLAHRKLSMDPQQSEHQTKGVENDAAKDIEQVGNVDVKDIEPTEVVGMQYETAKNECTPERTTTGTDAVAVTPLEVQPESNLNSTPGSKTKMVSKIEDMESTSQLEGECDRLSLDFDKGVDCENMDVTDPPPPEEQPTECSRRQAATPAINSDDSRLAPIAPEIDMIEGDESLGNMDMSLSNEEADKLTIEAKEPALSADTEYGSWTVKQLREFLKGVDVNCQGLRKKELVERVKQVCDSQEDRGASTGSALRVSDDTEAVEAPVPCTPTSDPVRNLLEKMTVLELRDRLKTLNLDTKGRKHELIARICGHSNDESNDADILVGTGAADPKTPDASRRSEEAEDVDALYPGDAAVTEPHHTVLNRNEAEDVHADGDDDAGLVEGEDVVDDEGGEDVAKDQLTELTVVVLRKRLVSLGLDSKGRKSELVDRLYNALASKKVSTSTPVGETEPEKTLEIVQSSTAEDSARNHFSSMSVSQLRDKLADLGLDTTGKKKILISRIFEAGEKAGMEAETNTAIDAQSAEQHSDHSETESNQKHNEHEHERRKYESMTVKQLRKIVEQRELEPRPKLRKSDLIDFLLECDHTAHGEASSSTLAEASMTESKEEVEATEFEKMSVAELRSTLRSRGECQVGKKAVLLQRLSAPTRVRRRSAAADNSRCANCLAGGVCKKN